MPKSSRETIRDALEKCIELHENKDYDVAEVILRQTLRAFSEQYYTEKDELAEEKLSTGMEYLAKMDAKSALPFFEEAYKLKPDSRTAFINCVYCNFHLDNYQTVWHIYEDRLRHFDQLVAYRKMFDPTKKWNGVDSLIGKTVLVFCEQGLGDTINFSRYLKYLKREGCKIILNCTNSLQRLFETIDFKFIVDKIVTKEDLSQEFMPEHDYHLPIMSLPYLLKMYVPNPEIYMDIYESAGISKEDEFHVGFITKGNPASSNDKIRSVNSNWFKQLRIPGIHLHNLHNSETLNNEFTNYVGKIKDLYDLGKLINDMDLIITVDTAVLHLAGAMGKEVWALIPFNPDWRWKLDGNKTVWYSNVKLFRQEYLGDWNGVFERVKKELQNKIRFSP